MKPIDIDELNMARKWLYTIPVDVRVAILKAWKSVDRCGVDGTWVLIASYRCHERIMANTVPK